MSIALPSAEPDLAFSNADRQRGVTAHSLTFESVAEHDRHWHQHRDRDVADEAGDVEERSAREPNVVMIPLAPESAR